MITIDIVIKDEKGKILGFEQPENTEMKFTFEVEGVKKAITLRNEVSNVL